MLGKGYQTTILFFLPKHFCINRIYLDCTFGFTMGTENEAPLAVSLLKKQQQLMSDISDSIHNAISYAVSFMH